MILTAAAVVTGEPEDAVLRPGWVEVTGSVITAVGAGGPPDGADSTDSTVVHDLGDATIVPGFVDTHIHGGGGGAFPDCVTDPDAVATGIAAHARHGTTSMIASLVSAHPGDLLRQVETLAPLVADGPLAGIHLEGPWLSSHKCGAHDPTALRAPDPAEISRVFEAAGGTIRMVTIAPELDGALDAIAQIVDAGAVAAVGHTNATYDQTVAAIEAGARVGTHLFNAMRPVHHREPGPVTALVEDPRVTVEMIGDGVHLHPAVYRNVCARVGAGRVSLVTDAMAATGMPDGAYHLGALAVDVVDSIARVAGTDTIAGSTATMEQLFRYAVANAPATAQDAPEDTAGNVTTDAAGVAAADAALLAAVQQTSITPARALGLPAAGICPGGRADLVVLDSTANPDVGTTDEPRDRLQVSAALRSGEWV
ncbi:MAG: N-acetylglucosamine-6-phosphate deacetylase [Corynebacterium sp.]|uniref:N-acetylglucosamine-6-phosphate deacetylase n=1 Tax=Corynebacterium TaxID=1716 RepID=UPI0026490D6A|nr:N-acetylglucosamine-6-phosphate deacetylase [Corynebacterium sp.]MDN5721904.1 N-acetylglucosamine-6-phosphate deacetylase [Corynebacterium sp.]MDN6281871.1 N-acetylglucosamine-6-phosphate deacetylase [Corynebacterium sp.]MDN6305083.1 N-acetylglucosamine-6-phosphate deacetylase [Corynebacterium sp.]MDN6367259.1 N-acetylglucosamine-6-phosphate deacetylase [Corynebacterium sp.]MDN6375187.1 N-acetylglucosamine-6-phosphate deacetylase [Corynebacterium sp.]